MKLLDQIALDTPAFFDTEGFAVDMLWRGIVTIPCIFNDDYIAVETDTGAALSSREPRAIINLVDLPDVAIGDNVSIMDENFLIRDIQRDGSQTNDTLLILQVVE